MWVPIIITGTGLYLGLKALKERKNVKPDSVGESQTETVSEQTDPAEIDMGTPPSEGGADPSTQPSTGGADPSTQASPSGSGPVIMPEGSYKPPIVNAINYSSATIKYGSTKNLTSKQYAAAQSEIGPLVGDLW